jgi:hypothetical protein
MRIAIFMLQGTHMDMYSQGQHSLGRSPDHGGLEIKQASLGSSNVCALKVEKDGVAIDVGSAGESGSLSVG